MADSKKYNGSTWQHSLRKLTTATKAVENPLYSDGTAITSYTIKGNTVQNGTPTPSNPVDVNGVGVRTENLFDVDDSVEGYLNNYGIVSPASDAMRTTGYVPVTPNTTYTITTTGSERIKAYNQSKEILTRETHNDYGISSNSTNTFTTDSNTYFIRFSFQPNKLPIMLNTGSTAKPYEPYGYKTPISSGGVTTNIYLGSTVSNRWIQKVVLTGQEAITTAGTNYSVPISPYIIDRNDLLCSHFFVGAYSGPLIKGQIRGSGSSSNSILFNYDNGSGGVDSFKNWLLQQYNNNTPVVIFYVRVNQAPVLNNEPLMKIGNYADTLSDAAQIPTTEGANSITVDTTVQPSEFTATWTGWHDASVKEWDASQWIE